MTSNFFTFLQARPGLSVAAASILALAAAYTAQYGFGLFPCELCLYQRIPYAIAIGLGLMAAFLNPAFARMALGACGLTFLVGAAIAAFHVGVEQHWWEGTDSCGMNLNATDIEVLREQIMNAPRARCDQAPWSFLGISMAGYNGIASLLLAFFCFAALKRRPLIQGDVPGA